jgi:iron complex transport system substrate-binding protein
LNRVLFKISILALTISVMLGPITVADCRSFTDALGREVSLRGDPHRIIPLAPNRTEILFFLGLGDRVVGVTTHCNYPPETALLPRVGSYINVNVEKILSLSPDLVFATFDGNERGTVELLEQAGIKVFVVNPRTARQVIETAYTMGVVCGIPDKASDLCQQLTKRVDRVVETTAGRIEPLVFLQINVQPIITVNRNTFHHDLIRLAGGRNLAAEEPITYPRFGLEEVVRRNPEVILISSMERGGRFERAREDWLKFKSIPAVQNRRVHLIDSDFIDRPAPRFIQGLETMARLIHPEAFR